MSPAKAALCTCGILNYMNDGCKCGALVVDLPEPELSDAILAEVNELLTSIWEQRCPSGTEVWIDGKRYITK